MARTSSPHDSALNPHLLTLLRASHILHHHGVVDAYGHISLRNPLDPSTFLMPRNLAPALLRSGADIVEYAVKDAEPVNADAPKGYLERYIHSEIYKKWQGVNAVVHSHDEQLVPWTILTGGQGLRAVFHMAGFLGQGVPNWDIEPTYEGEDSEEQVRDMLVNSTSLGASLAVAFEGEEADGDKAPDFPPHRVSLMRGHGYTALAENLEMAVFEAIYTQVNARLQAQALATAANLGLGAEGVKYLSKREAEGAWTMNLRTSSRPWGLWVKEVQTNSLYVNELDEDGGNNTSAIADVGVGESGENKIWYEREIREKKDELVWKDGNLVPAREL